MWGRSQIVIWEISGKTWLGIISKHSPQIYGSISRAMGWMARVQFPAWEDYFPLHSVQTGAGTLLSNGCRESGRGVKVTTHLHLVPRSRMVELYFHSPMSSWYSTYLIKHRDSVPFFTFYSPEILHGGTGEIHGGLIRIRTGSIWNARQSRHLHITKISLKYCSSSILHKLVCSLGLWPVV
jgi:hypothetical protein